MQRTIFLLLAMSGLCTTRGWYGGARSLEVPPDVCSVKISSEGDALIGRHFSPRLETEDSKAPAVLLLHGIPGTEQNFDIAYALRDAGFHCLLFHYRGCWGSEGSYSINGLPEDISNAFRWFTLQPNVDTQRIVVTGHSLGGYHALRLAAESLSGGVQGLSLRGVAAICPVVGTDAVGVPLSDDLAVNFAQFLRDVSPEQLQEQWAGLRATKHIFGDVPVQAQDSGRSIVKLPVLVISGDADPDFPPGYYERHLHEALKGCAAVSSSFVRLRHGDHALCRYRPEVVRRVVTFAKRCVGNCEPPRTLQERGYRLARRVKEFLDIVPLMAIASCVLGFMAGRFDASPEGQARMLEVDLALRKKEITIFDKDKK